MIFMTGCLLKNLSSWIIGRALIVSEVSSIFPHNLNQQMIGILWGSWLSSYATACDGFQDSLCESEFVFRLPAATTIRPLNQHIGKSPTVSQSLTATRKTSVQWISRCLSDSTGRTQSSLGTGSGVSSMILPSLDNSGP